MSKSNFPNILDVFTAPEKHTSLAGGDQPSILSHDVQHATILDTLAAIQKTIGVMNSTDVNSLTYKLANHTHVVDWSSIQNKPSFNYAANSGNANYATSAGSANTATTATNATNATNAANLVTSNWQVSEVGGVLQFKYNGVVKMTLDSSGNLTADGDITGFGL